MSITVSLINFYTSVFACLFWLHVMKQRLFLYFCFPPLHFFVYSFRLFLLLMYLIFLLYIRYHLLGLFICSSPFSCPVYLYIYRWYICVDITLFWISSSLFLSWACIVVKIMFRCSQKSWELLFLRERAVSQACKLHVRPLL